MADQKGKPPRPRGDTSKIYTDPADEPESAETREAAAKWLSQDWPDLDDQS